MMLQIWRRLLYVGLLEFIQLAGVVAWALIANHAIAEAGPPITIASEEAPAIRGARQDAPVRIQTQPQDVAVTTDLRPLIVVYSAPNCPGCKRWSEWWRLNRETSPFRFEVRPTPEWVTAVPAFHFQTSRQGKWAVAYGWYGLDNLKSAWQQENPGWSATADQVRRIPSRVLPDSAVASQDLQEVLPMLRRFAGTSGRFTFTPDSAIDAPVKDGLTIRYQTISGRYDTSGPAPRIVFDQPTPAGTVTIPYTLGAWRVGYRVEAATLEPDAVVVETDWKRVRIALED